MADETGQLLELGFDGSITSQIAALPLAAPSPPWVTRGYSACRFDFSGSHLWCAAHETKNTILIECRDARLESITARGRIDDPFGGSSVSFYETGDPGNVAIWLAAGQDGQCIYWAKRSGESIRHSLEPLLANTIPPAFSKDGKFLVVDEEELLRRMSYPEVAIAAWVKSPFGQDAPFDTSICYLDNRYALVSVREGRVAIVDTFQMQVSYEVVIENHEPRPTEHYYPTLVGDQTLCTDLSYFARFGDMLILVHGIDRPSDLKKWKDGLLHYSVGTILDQISAMRARDETESLWGPRETHDRSSD